MYPRSMVIDGDTYAERAVAGTLAGRYKPSSPQPASADKEIYVSENAPALETQGIWCETDSEGNPENLWIEDGN